MISIQDIREGMVFVLPSERMKDGDTGSSIYVTEVPASYGEVHELRSTSVLYFTVLSVDVVGGSDRSRVMAGIGETHVMDVRMDYIQKYGDMVVPSANEVKEEVKKVKEEGGGEGWRFGGRLGASQPVPGERVSESECPRASVRERGPVSRPAQRGGRCHDV